MEEIGRCRMEGGRQVGGWQGSWKGPAGAAVVRLNMEVVRSQVGGPGGSGSVFGAGRSNGSGNVGGDHSHCYHPLPRRCARPRRCILLPAHRCTHPRRCALPRRLGLGLGLDLGSRGDKKFYCSHTPCLTWCQKCR